MNKTYLIATVAALAITAPAQAERSGRDQKEERQKVERAQKPQRVQEQRGGQRVERQQVRAQARPQFERRERAVERAHPRPLFERRERGVEGVQARPQYERRERQVERVRARPQIERRERRVEGVEARPQLEQRARVQAAKQVRRAERLDRRLQRQVRQESKRDFQQLRRQERQATRVAGSQPTFEKRADAFQPRTEQRQRTWEGFANRVARFDGDRKERRDRTLLATIGQPASTDWYSNYTPLRYESYYQPTSAYYYSYDDDDGYLYRINRDNNYVSGLFPILGGAYSVGRPMPFYYDSYYNVPYGYSSLYYDTPDSYYRYGDGAIYQVDPTTKLISGIVALLSGQSFGIGQSLPMGYDTYNVPYAYRSTYYDTDDMWYRYDDGYIYGVDPDTRLIQTSYRVYGGYYVGEQWPSYAGFDVYDVPDYYGDLYYAEPGYDYRYASNGIYQVDPQSQMIAALVALVTGQNFAVGQRMPLGYDTYNLPLDYRDRYYDDDSHLYRYADGRIYQVAPDTRLIQRVIIV